MNNDWSDQGWIAIQFDVASLRIRRELGEHALALTGFAAESRSPPVISDIEPHCVGVWDRGGDVEESIAQMNSELSRQIPEFLDCLSLQELSDRASPGLLSGMCYALLGDRRRAIRECWNLWGHSAEHRDFSKLTRWSLTILGTFGLKPARMLGAAFDWRLRIRLILQTLANTDPVFVFDSRMLTGAFYDELSSRAAGNAEGLSPGELREFVRDKIEFDDDPEIYMIINGRMYFREELDAMLTKPLG